VPNTGLAFYNKASSWGKFRSNMQDYGLGYQGLAIAAKDRDGAGLKDGLATISGTVMVEPGWQFYLQESVRSFRKPGTSPDSSFLVPAVSNRSLQFTTLNVWNEGHAFIDNLHMSRTTTLSLSGVFYSANASRITSGTVCRDNPRNCSVGNNFASQMYDMGAGAFLCVLSGTKEYDAKNIEPGKPVKLPFAQKLDPRCTKGYNEGFLVAAQVVGAPSCKDPLKCSSPGKVLLDAGKPAYQVTLDGADLFLLATSRNAGCHQHSCKIKVSLDGMVLMSSEKPLPATCYGPRKSRALGGSPCVVKSYTIDDARAACPIVGEDDGPPLNGSTTEKLLIKKGCADNLCSYACKPSIRVNTNATVTGTKKLLFPQASIIGPRNLVITGRSIADRTCALRGVVKFTNLREQGTKKNGDTWIAQIDPDLRDPVVRTPLCFPMATIIFHAGVVINQEAKEIESLVAIQIEPHGRIRVITEIGKNSNSSATLYLRLDGITYHPLMKYVVTPNKCVPYCFDESKHVQTTSMQSGTGCSKYCTPSELNPVTRKKLNCRCDMIKRLECWARGNKNSIRCGQFKKLMGIRMAAGTNTSNSSYANAKCALTCARQLANL